MRRLFLISFGCFAIILYVLSYVFLSDRHSGRARGAGEYFHYRDFNYPLEVYVFVPAAFCEAELIQIFPKSFLNNPSWSETPQRLVIRVPDNSTTFWFPPWSKKKIQG